MFQLFFKNGQTQHGNPHLQKQETLPNQGEITVLFHVAVHN